MAQALPCQHMHAASTIAPRPADMALKPVKWAVPPFPVDWSGSASGSSEGANDDPRRGYDGMRPRRLPADPPDHALIRAALDLPGQAEPGGRSVDLGGRSPKAHELPLVRLRPTRCPRLDVLDVWQPAATANPFDLDPHTRPQNGCYL
jgi:hypothetical protein